MPFGGMLGASPVALAFWCAICRDGATVAYGERFLATEDTELEGEIQRIQECW